MSKYSISKKLDAPFEAAVGKAREALEAAGFEILGELDIAAVMKRRLDKDFRRYMVLLACQPQMAHKALTIETEFGLFLPCHIAVYDNDEGGSTVAAIDPVVATSMIENPALAIIAREMREKLEMIINAIG